MFNAFKHLALRYLIWGLKLSFLLKRMPRYLDFSKTGIGEPYKCKTGSSSDRNVPTVFLIRNFKTILYC